MRIDCVPMGSPSGLPCKVGMGLNGLGGESNKEPMEIERIWISIWPSLGLFLALVGTFGNPAFFLGKSEEKKIQRGEKRKI